MVEKNKSWRKLVKEPVNKLSTDVSINKTCVILFSFILLVRFANDSDILFLIYAECSPFFYQRVGQKYIIQELKR
jgi:hypothetical protein